MHFTYCPHCGSKSILKEIGDEGKIPYCQTCKVPLWDMFRTCIICAVVNEENEVALLRQDYVSTTNYVCVAGVMKMGESAEETVCREINEELGLTVESMEYMRSYPMPARELLMLGYKVTVKKDTFMLSGEVDAAKWFKFEDALSNMREGSVAWQLVKSVIEGTQQEGAERVAGRTKI